MITEILKKINRCGNISKALRLNLLEEVLHTIIDEEIAQGFKVPPYSQFDIQTPFWKKQTSLILGLMSVLKYLDVPNLPRINQFIIECAGLGAYKFGVGWQPTQLGAIEGKYHFKTGILVSPQQNETQATDWLQQKLGRGPFLASIRKETTLEPREESSYWVAVTHIEEPLIYCNDPTKPPRNVQGSTSIKEFLKVWERQIIIIRK